MPINGVDAPEALSIREHSSNVASTCNGITSAGRQCRRTVAHSPGARFDKLYCWQHLSQAAGATEPSATAAPRPPVSQTKLDNRYAVPLRARSSVETFIQRVGITPVEDKRIRPVDVHAGRPGKQRASPADPKPLGSAKDHHQQRKPLNSEKQHHVPRRTEARPARQRPGFWALLCCLVEADENDDYMEVVRHRKRVSTTTSSTPRREPTETEIRSDPRISNVAPMPLSHRPNLSPRRSSNSQTRALLDLLPEHVSPQTSAALLAELSKPVSVHDEEGYIYIFWLTPSQKAAPSTHATESVLASLSGRPAHARQVSDVMTEFSFDGTEPPNRGRKTIMLKIGRANNVTRRMNEWQRQCGFQLSLLRWYPYRSAGHMPSPSRPLQESQQHGTAGDRAPRHAHIDGQASTDSTKVPYVKRVERLIHLELAEHRVKRQCSACGREHREWFEIEANQAGVTGVDECVKRWVRWAQGAVA